MTAQKKPNGNLGVMRKLKKVSKNCKFELFREWEATESLKREAKRRQLDLDHGVDAEVDDGETAQSGGDSRTLPQVPA